jgi:DNA-directed RNA polymerase subunit L
MNNNINIEIITTNEDGSETVETVAAAVVNSAEELEALFARAAEKRVA